MLEVQFQNRACNSNRGNIKFYVCAHVGISRPQILYADMWVYLLLNHILPTTENFKTSIDSKNKNLSVYRYNITGILTLYYCNIAQFSNYKHNVIKQ